MERKSSVLRVDGTPMPVVFGHITGETVRLVVKTAKGNNNSKANRRERDKVVWHSTIRIKVLQTKNKNVWTTSVDTWQIKLA